MEQLFRKHYLDLVRLASLWTVNTAEAEDVVQDAFANLQLSEISSPLPFLRTVVANRARSAVRRKNSERRAIDRLAAAPLAGADVSEDPLAAFDRALMLSIRRLPNRQ
ncbi:RNA polymerase sigma factor [Nakamurella lactea]|uniref:RNA polymerase sigma factor n=1 Tax=Nakamurella lactea TaxID=459515 RepID=UPI00041AD1A3|nr:sigma factor [Nakamurella lactea]